MRAALALLLLLVPAPPDDAADLEALVKDFFAAFAAKDAKKIMASWSEKSERRKSFQEELEAALQAPPATPPSDPQAQVVHNKDGHAYLGLSFKGKWSKADEVWTDETSTHWTLQFKKEDGKWKWWDVSSTSDLIIQVLLNEPAEKHREYLEDARDVLGNRMITTLCDAIVPLFESGEADKARKYALLAVEVADFTGRKDLQLKAHVHWGVAGSQIGQAAESKDSLIRAKALAIELKDAESEGVARAYLGFSLLDSNAPDAALAELAVAQQILEKLEQHEMVVVTRIFTAMAHEKRGALAQALEAARAALKAAEDRAPGQRANAWDAIARIQWERTDNAAAMTSAEAGLKLATDPSDFAIRAKLLNTQGLVHQVASEYPAALEKFEAAYRGCADNKLWRLAGGIKNNIGQTYWEERKLEKAEETLREAMKILVEARDFPMASIVRNNLGTVLRLRGEFDEAIGFFRASVEESRKLASPAAPILPLTNLAEILGAHGDYDEALQAAEEAADLAGRHGNRNERYSAHLAVGRTCERRGGLKNLERAVAELRRAAGFLETTRRELRDQQMQQGFLSRHAPLYALLADVCLKTGKRAEAFAASEEMKGRTLVELLEKGPDRIAKSMSSDERREEARLEEELNALTRKLDSVVLTDAREALGAEIAKARGSLDDLRRGVALRIPDLEALRGRFAPVTLAAVNKAVLSGPRRTGVVSYLMGEDRLLALLLLPGADEAEVRFVRRDIRPDQLQDLVDQFWSACATPESEVAGPARKLYEVLLRDAAGLLDVEHLIILPDGPLNGIPFHALQDGSGRYVIERWSVSYAPSATALVKMEELAERRRAQPPAGRSALLAVGSPTMPPGLGDLPGAKREAEAVAAAFKVQALTGADATKSAVRKSMENARLILLATHGKVDEASPLYSHVVLARDGTNDGLLRAREIADLDLKADLVVLSACDTGLGRKVRGEGVVGLTWALFAGGTPSSVVALWQVADASAGGLIQPFFEGVGAADPRPEGAKSLAVCLQDAQLRLLRDGKHAHPYYWAPFILVGHAGR